MHIVVIFTIIYRGYVGTNIFTLSYMVNVFPVEAILAFHTSEEFCVDNSDELTWFFRNIVTCIEHFIISLDRLAKGSGCLLRN